MIFKASWEKTQTPHNLSKELIEQFVEQAYPNQKLIYFEIIEGGCANLNIKIQLDQQDHPLLLRVYLRDPASVIKEQKLSTLLKNKIPIPQFLYTGEYKKYTFAIMNFIDGMTLRDLLLSDHTYDLSNIMQQIGSILAQIASCKFDEEKSQPNLREFIQTYLNNPPVQHLIPDSVFSKIRHYFNVYAYLLTKITDYHLVHGDFDPSNILVSQRDNKWVISGILDWEFFFIGSPLWDIANMLRDADKLPPDYENSFINSVIEHGIKLPENWKIITHLLNLVSLLDCLLRSNPETQPNRVSDIQATIVRILQKLDTLKAKKQIQVLPYNPNWPKLFSQEAERLEKALGSHCFEIHHIGSTSIPGLAAKEDIDILCVVDNLSASLVLEDIRYIFKGELNIPLRYFFSKNSSECKVNLHVTEVGHGFINLNLTFCHHLRHHHDDRQAYQDLKYNLLKDPSSFERINGSFPKYTLEKSSFINGILDKAEYDGITYNFCLHYAEWKAAKHFRQTEFFDKAQIQDPYTWTFNDPDHVHMVMYMGTKIIGYAHIQLWEHNQAILRMIIIENSYRNKGFGRQFLTLIERWLKHKGYQQLNIESSAKALNFYKQNNYINIKFSDPDGYERDPDDIQVGKIL